jgi:hypothetical protein
MAEHPSLAVSRQLLLVVAEDWETSTGQVFRFVRDRPNAVWDLVDKSDVSLGRNGLAWGKGLHDRENWNGPNKREGDGKSPAGIFALGTAFGYAPPEDSGVSEFPYLQITSSIRGIEDPESIYYNQLVDMVQVLNPDWNAADEMLREDGLYEWGIVVKHNASPGRQSPGLGSCIFLHVWRGAGKPTAGCTAMPAERMAKLTRWVRSSAEPRLVQLTSADYAEAQRRWELPSIPP